MEKEYGYVDKVVKDGTFTCVLTNPPFGKDLTMGPREARLNSYSISNRPKKASDPETEFLKTEFEQRELGIVFLERCFRLLVKGGRLGIILPETYFFSSSYMWLQGWLETHFIMRGVINIPMEAFQGFCRAKTNFYILEKRRDHHA